MVKLLGKYEYPEGYYYSKDHIWAKIENGKVRVGVTDFAQQSGGKIRFLRLRPPGKKVEKGKGLGTLETGKWVGQLISPLSGEIVEINKELRRKASLANEDPYGKGWMSVLQPSNLDEELKDLFADVNDIKPWLEQEEAKYAEKSGTE